MSAEDTRTVLIALTVPAHFADLDKPTLVRKLAGNHHILPALAAQIIRWAHTDDIHPKLKAVADEIAAESP